MRCDANENVWKNIFFILHWFQKNFWSDLCNSRLMWLLVFKYLQVTKSYIRHFTYLLVPFSDFSGNQEFLVLVNSCHEYQNSNSPSSSNVAKVSLFNLLLKHDSGIPLRDTVVRGTKQSKSKNVNLKLEYPTFELETLTICISRSCIPVQSLLVIFTIHGNSLF